MERINTSHDGKWFVEGGKLRAAYEEDLNRMKEAQKNAAIAGLENTRNQALSNLQAERNQNAATYNQQRSSANAQNRLSARNFQEYLASTGRANSGLSAQARMQNANNLNTSINALNAGEAAALADIGRRTTDAQNAYNTGLAGATAQIEADYIKNLLAERDKQAQRDLQERQFQEQIRQFNENLALQKQQLYSRFNSGSGGGSSSRKSSGGTSKYTDTGNTVAVGVGQAAGVPNRSIAGMSIIDTPVYQKGADYYIKQASGKMKKILK